MKSRRSSRGRSLARTRRRTGLEGVQGEGTGAEREELSADPPVRAAGGPGTDPAVSEGAGGGAEGVAVVVGSVEAWLDRWFLPLAIGIVVLAAAIRLPELALNPFHHDEGVNGYFTTRLVRENAYAYDPANYHGPSLYYFALLAEILFGLTTEAMRLVPVVFGVLAVAMVLPLRRYLGTVAVLAAALLLALSPGMVYVSRYFIHEGLLVGFSVGLFTCGVLYLDRRRPALLVPIAVFAALLFTTKETAIVTVLVWVIAGLLAHGWVELRDPGRHNRLALAAQSLASRGRRLELPAGARAPKSIWVDGVEYRPAALSSRSDEPAADRPRSAPERQGGGGHGPFTSRERPTWTQLAAAALIFLSIWVLLFTSLFTNPDGLRASLQTFAIWTQTGGETQIQPLTKYLEWMLAADAPILLLGVGGGLLVAWRARDRLTVFVGLWALGITLAYSLIQYKTPWIAVNMLVPLALLAGILVRDLTLVPGRRVLAALLLGGAVLVSGYQAIDLNYSRYDDETYPYVFVHTSRETLAMLDEIERAASEAGTGTATGIVIYSPDYWPLPWYLRDYPRAGFFGQIVETSELVVIAKVEQEAELPAAFTEAYRRQGEYVLRPGVRLALFLRRETFGP